METIKSLAVFIGRTGGPWEDDDIESFIWEAIEARVPVISIVLDSAQQEVDLPTYLKRKTVIDFRERGNGSISQIVDAVRNRV